MKFYSSSLELFILRTHIIVHRIGCRSKISIRTFFGFVASRPTLSRFLNLNGFTLIISKIFYKYININISCIYLSLNKNLFTQLSQFGGIQFFKICYSDSPRTYLQFSQFNDLLPECLSIFLYVNISWPSGRLANDKHPVHISRV